MLHITAATVAMALTLTIASLPVNSSAADDVFSECSEAYDPAEALVACTRIIESSWATEHQLKHAFNNRANAADYLGKPHAAIEDYSLALTIDPHFINARYNRGATYLALKDFSSAIADLNSVLKLDPTRIEALNNRGLALLERGDLDAAIEDFTSVLRLDAGYAYAYNNRGVAWRRKGDSQRAIADFSHAIELLPTYVGALVSRGELHLAAGNREAATQDFRQALAANPEHAGAKKSLEILATPATQSQNWQR